MVYPSYYESLSSVIRIAGETAISYFKALKRTDIKIKPDGTPVTLADERIEAFIVEAIKGYFPDHGILAEEQGEVLKNKDCYWVIDPLDGTKNYIRGIPFFSVTLALIKQGQPIFGIVYAPVTNDLFFAEKGQGAWRKKGFEGESIPLRVGSTGDITTSQLIFNRGNKPFHQIAGIIDGLSPFIQSGHSYGSMALELAYVAAGEFEGLVSVDASPWDYAAGVLLVQEAGGVVTDFSGKTYRDSFPEILASTKKLHLQLLQLIQGGKSF